MVLGGDVGGTKTILGLFRLSGGKLVRVREAVYGSQEAASLETMVRDFLGRGRERPSRATFGVAGPVLRGRSQVVNLRWPVDEGRLSRATGIRHVRVLNDLEATGWGLSKLTSRQIVNLTPLLRPQPGNAALIAPGTGLGMSILAWDGHRHRPSAGEGGHQDFPPRNEAEWELRSFMERRLGGRVSVERIVAGPGLSAIYDFLVASGRGERTSRMSERLAAGDRNAAVSDAGVSGDDPTAERAVEIFVSLFGAAAGNLALVSRSVAGVWIAGGIAPKVLPMLRSGEFLEAFRDKGRLRPLLEKIPVKVVLEPRTALLGAAAHAARETAAAGRR